MRSSRVPSFAPSAFVRLAVYATTLAAVAAAAAADSNPDSNPAFSDSVQLSAPALPSPAPPLAFDVALPAAPAGLSIAQQGAFLGFSVEMSVATQVLGKNLQSVSPVFTRLLDNIAERGGAVRVRVGGNSQETAVLVDSVDGGTVMSKNNGDTSNPTDTPSISYTKELISMMAKISTSTNAYWYLGIPFNDTNFRLGIAEAGQSILGDRLLGLQLGNEPDLYGRHGLGGRPSTYSQFDYFGEFGLGVAAFKNDANIPKKANMLLGPSIGASNWSPEMVWDTGYVDAYSDFLGALTVERYPASNCGATIDVGQDVNPQDELVALMQHQAALNYTAPYLNSSAFAQQHGKPFMVMEFNTGTCSGFPGLSDAFGAALWALDTSLQMAYANFSGALLHVGGQDAYYNPFTAPPGAEAKTHQWTIGPVYYAALAMAEALGSSNKSQVLDLGANGANTYTPAYAVYEGAAAQRVVLFNYMTDASGAHDYKASVQVPADVSSVQVKYLRSSSVASKSNITWAGQTFGGVFESNGQPQGALDVQTVACAGGKCAVSVPAPGAALVFLTPQALQASTPTSTAAVPSGSGTGSGTGTPGASSTTKTKAKNTAAHGGARLSAAGFVVACSLMVHIL